MTASALLPVLDASANPREVIDHIGTAMWVFDIDRGRVLWANAAALAVWQAEELAELQARDMLSTMSPTVQRRLHQYQSDFRDSAASFSELWTLYPRGVPHTLRVRFSGVRLADGRIGMLCEGQTEGTLAPEALRSADALLHTQLMISLHRMDGHTLYLNLAAREAFKGHHANLQDRFVHAEDCTQLLETVARQGECNTTVRVQNPSGLYWHELNARSCLDPASGTPSVLISATDVSRLKEAESMARAMAQHDPLTGLPNLGSW
ncbi:MAG TPA: PAS domain-containing protein [Rhodanobacteraceae bacterium]|nr:PAS domain-containing protein [Rhodanobacteraceae bacterium]